MGCTLAIWFLALGRLPYSQLCHILPDWTSCREIAQSLIVMIHFLSLYIYSKRVSLFPSQRSGNLLTQTKVRICVLKSKNIFNTTNRSCYVIIIYCCVTSYLETEWLTTTNIYDLKASVCQESGCGVAECLWLRVSDKAEVKVVRVAVISRFHQRWVFQAHASGFWLDSVPTELLDRRR